MHKMRLYLTILIGSVILLSAFQNCDNSNYKIEPSVKLTKFTTFSNSGTGNGTGYEGKLTDGEYYRLVENSSCSDSPDQFFGKFIISPNQISLLRDGCTSVNVGFSPSDNRLFQSPFFRDLIAINDAIFERAKEEIKPTKITAAWCFVTSENGVNRDIVIQTSSQKDSYQATLIQTQKDSSTGLIDDQRTESILVDRTLTNETLAFSSSSYGFTLELHLANKNNFRVPGHLKALTNIGELDQAVTCIAPSNEPVILAPSQLVGFWNFEDKSSSGTLSDLDLVADASPSGNIGTVHNLNGTGFNVINGKRGSGVSLDGIDDFIDISGLATSISTDFTISLWYQTIYSQSKKFLITGNLNGTSNQFKLGFGKCFTTVSVSELMTEFGNDCYWSGVKPIDTIWHHVVFTATPSNAILYLDGISKDQRPTTYLLDTTVKWSIGQDYDAVGPTDFYKGNLDEVMFWNSAFNADQVKKLFESQ